jgi:hypothetical protein
VSKLVERSAEAAQLRAALAKLSADFTRICWVCTMPFGSKIGSRKTIAGASASADAVLHAMGQIGLEFALYPVGFPRAAGLDQIVFCTQLHYGGQRRGHVPAFQARTMYIDCANTPKRRVISSFHHELWHFADYTMLGRDYEFADAEWCAHARASCLRREPRLSCVGLRTRYAVLRRAPHRAQANAQPAGLSVRQRRRGDARG